jgi:hypothetical protein
MFDLENQQLFLQLSIIPHIKLSAKWKNISYKFFLNSISFMHLNWIYFLQYFAGQLWYQVISVPFQSQLWGIKMWSSLSSSANHHWRLIFQKILSHIILHLITEYFFLSIQFDIRAEFLVFYGSFCNNNLYDLTIYNYQKHTHS